MTMIDKLPGYYRKSTVVASLYKAVQNMIDKLADDIDAEILKLFITTTEDFTLHEKDVGLTEIDTDLKTRRARVIAKLQGSRPFTKLELENLICIYDKAGCKITENYADYTVTILFDGEKGIPDNIEEIKAAVEEVKPAHLHIEYQYVYNTWQQLYSELHYQKWSDIADNTTWEMLAVDDKQYLYVDENGRVWMSDNKRNAYLIYIDDIPYARLL